MSLLTSAPTNRSNSTHEFSPDVTSLDDWRIRPDEPPQPGPGPAVFFSCGEHHSIYFLGARIALFLLLIALALPATAGVRAVGDIGLTVGDLDRAMEFYTKVLPFEKVGESAASGTETDQLYSLREARTRTARLRLGDEFITLTSHPGNPGRPIPADSRSYDHWFQHIAIVVSDMDRAYAHLRRHKVKHVSTAPQTLPDWNPNAGGIRAFYFRDPENHVLEIIWFPAGKGDVKWQRATDANTNAPLFLGIDHTAIVVSDTDRSLALYRDLLGLKVAGESENYGTEQEHLNQVFGARLRITALRAEKGPGIEFLEYITPPGGRPLPADARANDLVFWHTHLHTGSWDKLTAGLQQSGVVPVSSAIVRGPGGAHQWIVRDPDGHALHLTGDNESPLANHR